MNLLLSYDIDEDLSTTQSNTKNLEKSNGNGEFSDKLDLDYSLKSLNNASDDSPLSNVPNPMSPLPSNRQYLHLNSTLLSKKYSASVTNTHEEKPVVDTPSKIRGFPPPLKLYQFDNQPMKPPQNIAGIFNNQETYDIDIPSADVEKVQYHRFFVLYIRLSIEIL